jgi:hypothetical protein
MQLDPRKILITENKVPLSKYCLRVANAAFPFFGAAALILGSYLIAQKVMADFYLGKSLANDVQHSDTFSGNEEAEQGARADQSSMDDFISKLLNKVDSIPAIAQLKSIRGIAETGNEKFIFVAQKIEDTIRVTNFDETKLVTFQIQESGLIQKETSPAVDINFLLVAKVVSYHIGLTQNVPSMLARALDDNDQVSAERVRVDGRVLRKLILPPSSPVDEGLSGTVLYIRESDMNIVEVEAIPGLSSHCRFCFDDFTTTGGVERPQRTIANLQGLNRVTLDILSAR